MNDVFKEKADLYTSKIYKSEMAAVRAVKFIEDKEYFMETKTLLDSECKFYDTGSSICLDFGRHITGYFRFEMGQYREYLDAPVKLKVKFAETPYEMRRDFSTYKGGLSSSWLQEEIITVDTKGEVRLPRRYAFRYVEISVLQTSHLITLKDFIATACTSADYSQLNEVNCDDSIKKIDSIAVDTLAECMQDVFEDGPKRDRRLWIGDFRLQALTNYYTFGNTDIVKRCLYLFAAFDSDDKLLPSYVYTKPALETGDAHLVSYALLFTVALCDYFEYTNDIAVAEDLFNTAKRQIDITQKMLDKNLILTMPKDYGWWTFIDWSEAKEITSTMGIYIYTINSFSELCKKLGRIAESEYYDNFAIRLKRASLEFLYDGNVFRNKYDNYQYSVHSQVWMILAGVVSKKDAQRILKECIGNGEYCSPVTPYMHHYVVEALIKSELYDMAKQYILDYWGAMVNVGADTFWEVFVKDNPYSSPYGDVIMNSACHAWSCTPSYFIRKYEYIK